MGIHTETSVLFQTRISIVRAHIFPRQNYLNGFYQGRLGKGKVLWKRALPPGYPHPTPPPKREGEPRVGHTRLSHRAGQGKSWAWPLPCQARQTYSSYPVHFAATALAFWVKFKVLVLISKSLYRPSYYTVWDHPTLSLWPPTVSCSATHGLLMCLALNLPICWVSSKDD